MSIQLTVDAETWKGLGDQQKLYVEKDGGYVLDIEGGAVAQSDFDELKKANETLTGQVTGPDGKSWKEMFEGSQKANQAIRGERDNFEGELKKWRAIGTLEETQKLKDELDAFKQKGEGLDTAQKENTELKGQIRALTDERDALKQSATQLTTERDELAKFKATAEKLTADNKAKEQIEAVVEKLEGANKRGLAMMMFDKYDANKLVFDKDGNLIDPKGNLSLQAYAKDLMEAMNLYATPPTTPGRATPPGGGQPPASKTVDGASLAAMLGY